MMPKYARLADCPVAQMVQKWQDIHNGNNPVPLFDDALRVGHEPTYIMEILVNSLNQGIRIEKQQGHGGSAANGQRKSGGGCVRGPRKGPGGVIHETRQGSGWRSCTTALSITHVMGSLPAGGSNATGRASRSKSIRVVTAEKVNNEFQGHYRAVQSLSRKKVRGLSNWRTHAMLTASSIVRSITSTTLINHLNGFATVRVVFF
jgi:hypothetical protein